MLELKKISMIFRTETVETKALNKIDFSVKQGEFVAIMGPSGCGKSTLLNILGLLDNPSEGSYTFMGKELAKYSEKHRADIRKGNIGFVFQNFNLIDELDVFQNIELPLLYLDIKRAERKKKVNRVMEQMNISHRSKHFPAQLSGGQQQRVAVARAIVAKPKLILADEPTGNLDSKNGEEVMNILKQLHHGGTSIIMVTHSKLDASYAQRTVNLYDGQIITENISQDAGFVAV
ncbi:MAG: phosphonate ABC transporter ATP-binding protein [Bacteroidetes bacterium 4572_117]|nr:MAG: phosphonate ABC transporter ATP-binding protein [Bacteroidetes bacterium 4572_117]